MALLFEYRRIQNTVVLTVVKREQARDRWRSTVDGLGGREVRDLKSAIGKQRLLVDDVTRRRNQWVTRCQDVGFALPDTAYAFEAFQLRAATARAELEESNQDRQVRYDLAAMAAEARRRVEELRGQIEALTRQKSNIDERLLQVRRLLLESAGVPRERLPFAGELIDVEPQESRWRGAIERVLRSFARTLLVPDDLYPFVSEFVEANHLGTRLVYERLPPGGVEPTPVSDPRSLVNKLRVAESEAAEWVGAELGRRFDYACVESAAELRATSRGVTVAGQVRHSTTRHEKDDRTRINDRSTWVLGTSTEAKRHLLEESFREASAALGAASSERDDADSTRGERLRNASLLDRMLELTWDEIDVASATGELCRLEEELQALVAGATGLADAKRQLARAEEGLSNAQTTRNDVFGQFTLATHKAATAEKRLSELREALDGALEPPPEVRAALTERIQRLGASHNSVELLAQQELGQERSEVGRRSARAGGRAERAMQSYKTDWPIPAQDWGINVDFLPDFLGRLDLLEADRLPEFEDRFFTLLRTQSQNNIGILSTRLRNARREVRERVDPINASLRLTEYAPGCHLHVRVDDRRNPEVTDFLQTLSVIAGGTLAEPIGAGVEDEDRDRAEQGFAQMKNLLHRLASPEAADQRWRQQCLDTRQHVKFLAEVRDNDGHAVDFLAGAGGLSGGERQKLVIFCLAAALRYQLARNGAETPSYGLVVLDEAFDKTDPAFTKAGLEVFHRFGFQLLLATPLKMLQTLEDYVGGAAVVLNETGCGSRLEYLAFDEGAGDQDASAPTTDVQESLL